jgi:hypothetical protein
MSINDAQIKAMIAGVNMVYEALSSSPKIVCATCEADKMLKLCRECGQCWCSDPKASSDCYRWHECAQADGRNSYDGTRG